jgi:transglutaminase-like putative cysteine protease
MIYNIYHKTTFDYQSIVSFSHNIARLKPKESAYQKLLAFSMQVTPQEYESHDFFDLFGNNNTHLVIREPHQSLSVIGESKVEISLEKIQERMNIFASNTISYGDTLERLCKFHVDDIEAKQFLFESKLISRKSQQIKEYALKSFQKDRDVFEATQEFMGRIFHDFEFVSGFSDITTSVEKIFEAKKGVCQDFAQFAISALRSIGLPAKYMSGYIETLPPDGEAKLFGADASHAWFAVYIPNAGWAEFDPTNNMLPREQHIVLGSGRDYYDISPLKGVVISSGGSHLSVMVDVKREEAKLYSQTQTQSQF